MDYATTASQHPLLKELIETILRFQARGKINSDTAQRLIGEAFAQAREERLTSAHYQALLDLEDGKIPENMFTLAIVEPEKYPEPEDLTADSKGKEEND